MVFSIWLTSKLQQRDTYQPQGTASCGRPNTSHKDTARLKAARFHSTTPREKKKKQIKSTLQFFFNATEFKDLRKSNSFQLHKRFSLTWKDTNIQVSNKSKKYINKTTAGKPLQRAIGSIQTTYRLLHAIYMQKRQQVLVKTLRYSSFFTDFSLLFDSKKSLDVLG